MSSWCGWSSGRGNAPPAERRQRRRQALAEPWVRGDLGQRHARQREAAFRAWRFALLCQATRRGRREVRPRSLRSILYYDEYARNLATQPGTSPTHPGKTEGRLARAGIRSIRAPRAAGPRPRPTGAGPPTRCRPERRPAFPLRAIQAPTRQDGGGARECARETPARRPKGGTRCEGATGRAIARPVF